MILPLEIEDPSGTHDCHEIPYGFKKVDSPANCSDWNMPNSVQGYQVYECKECADIWGCRFQWDAGTGDDDHWKRFGAANPANVKRHY